MYYTVYKVTNKMNGKFYIGTHKTKNLDDDYMGSGKLLNYAINKYGLENFEKEILFIFDNPDEMFAKEAEIVNEDFLAEENTYNLKVGGFGGWDYNNTESGIRNREWTFERWGKAGNKKFLKRLKEDPEFYQNHCNKMKKVGKLGNQALQAKYPEGVFKGKQHTDETKKKMSEKAKKRLKDPENNPMYGTHWYYHPDTLENIKCKSVEEVPNGFIKGRKFKNELKPRKHKKCLVCGDDTGSSKAKYCNYHRTQVRKENSKKAWLKNKDKNIENLKKGREKGIKRPRN